MRAVATGDFGGGTGQISCLSLWKEEKDNKMSLNRKFTETVLRSVQSTSGVRQHVFQVPTTTAQTLLPSDWQGVEGGSESAARDSPDLPADPRLQGSNRVHRAAVHFTLEVAPKEKVSHSEVGGPRWPGMGAAAGNHLARKCILEMGEDTGRDVCRSPILLDPHARLWQAQLV